MAEVRDNLFVCLAAEAMISCVRVNDGGGGGDRNICFPTTLPVY